MMPRVWWFSFAFFFFNFSLETPLALTLKTAENRPIIILIFHRHTAVLLLVTQIARENLLPVTPETTESLPSYTVN